MKKLFILAVGAMVIMAGPAACLAHNFWINAFESFEHKPGHVMVSLGYGHTIPMDDLLNGQYPLYLESYEMVGPDRVRVDFPLPEMKKEKQRITGTGLRIRGGDLGIQKLALTDQSATGVYQIGAATKETYYSLYRDEKGRTKWVIRPMDEVKEGKVFASTRYKGYAKAAFALETWEGAKPLGHDLEILPACDLGKARKGEPVVFEVYFMGKPFSPHSDDPHYLMAANKTFSDPDNRLVAAPILNGKVKIRLPEAGQWLVGAFVRKNVAQAPALKPLAEKCMTATYSASFTFHLMP